MPRPSPVTDAVRALITRSGQHLWALDELHDRVREQVASANFSSVLRAVGTLETAGLLDRIDVADGKARYELRQEHHEHVKCSSCGRIQQVPGCVLEEAAATVKASTGFVVTGHQLVFSGLCGECAQVST
ncbi:MAG TPA: transcriptional repressor [Candidatus Solibacter sp.]|jgi:Fe2+ or Zn2+ uptake regulation protein|nr:transcriptional repressor [Candidatus Solibacter sp.]